MTTTVAPSAYSAADALAATNAARLKSPEQVKARIEAQASEFEAVFLSSALKTMFENVGTDPTLIGGTGSESWRELLVDEYAKSFSARGGIGLAEPIANQLLKMQEIDA
ncbi:rod-binding protein [Methylobrevis pamukkalensis]|uniref:Chemotactic signal-response protein CheL n=1 Tax=Methylobrevis pamukkalensis TaxID=1439726 RepID=A0A1E3GZI8_9HYPH|nr:rod-binding protein [Methylobrevis pamukkalensis]ODN69335.1 chemotactic signal-response protein CheL [Methylobrevis pamukkalensis]